MKHNLQLDSWLKLNNKNMKKKIVEQKELNVGLGDKVKFWNWWYRYGYQKTKVSNYGTVVATTKDYVTVKTNARTKITISKDKIMEIL